MESMGGGLKGINIMTIVFALLALVAVAFMFHFETAYNNQLERNSTLHEELMAEMESHKKTLKAYQDTVNMLIRAKEYSHRLNKENDSLLNTYYALKDKFNDKTKYNQKDG